MRVMVLIKANEQSEAGEMPSEKLLTEMTAFNEELVKAGIMLAGDGLHPSSKGVRVEFSGSDRKVINGPFAETKELLAGYWVWQVKDMDEAIEWVKRIPNPDEGTEGIVEIRPVFEFDDFGDELTPELREKNEQLREQEARLRQEAEASQYEPGHDVAEGEDLDQVKALMAMVRLHPVPLERVLGIARSIENRDERDRTLVFLAEKLAEKGEEEPARIVAGAIGDAILRSRTLARIAEPPPDTHRG
jgi:hypothetical protein